MCTSQCIHWFIFKRHEKKQQPIYILSLSLWVCKYPLPCFCWPTPPIKSHLSKKPPLTLSACLHSLPVFSVYSYWFPPTHSLSPFSFLDFVQSQWLVSGKSEVESWVEKAWVGEACKSKKGKEVSNNGKKGCTAAKIEKEPSRGRKGWESSSLRGGAGEKERIWLGSSQSHANNFLSATKAGRGEEVGK